MPPRKSDATKVIAGAVEDVTAAAAKDAGRDGVNIEDLNLPKSIVTRLAKGALPPNTQIQGNAMLAMTKSATVFVNYLAAHANEYAQRENRKVLAPQDVFRALDDLEFPDFKPRLESELAKFNELQAEKKSNQRNKLAASKAQGKTGSPSAAGGEEGHVEGEGEGALARDGQPASKRARMENGGSSSGLGGDGAKGKGRAGDETADENDEDEDDVDGDIDVDVDADEDDDEEDEDREGDDTLDVDEQLDDGHEDVEAEDEALDNGEDSE